MDDRSGGKRASLNTAHVPLKTVLDGITDPVVIVDETNRIVDANRAAGDLFDCLPEALVGRSWFDCYPDEDRDGFESLVEQGSKERVERYEDGDPIRIETVAGECRPVEVTLQRISDGDGSVQVCLYRDITERIERERALRETVARLETLFEASPVPMAVLDEEGTVEHWNRAAETTFGWESAAVIGGQYPLFPDETEREGFFDRLADGERIVGMETTHQGEDGSLVDVELYAQPLHDDGAGNSIIVSAIDITALTQREQHLSVLHRIMQHSLRNKINVIDAVAERFADEDGESVDRLLTATEELIRLSDRAERIDRDLRRVGNPIPVALDSMLRSVHDGTRSEYPQADLRLEEGIPDVPVADIARTVFEELLAHAIEQSTASEPAVGSSVSVGPRITVEIAGDREELTASERAFLQRDEPAALLHGSRLGLAHADMLVTELGGQLSARDDDGTTIRVELPQVDT